jgi:hypothetical protein
MADFQTYLFAGLTLAGVVALWYFTRNTMLGKEIMPWLFGATVIVLVLITFKNKIPFVSSIIGWFKDKFAKSKIEDLQKDIKRLEADKVAGLKSADQLTADAKALEAKANEYHGQVKALDDMIKPKLEDQATRKDPIQAGKDALPVDTGDSVENAKRLMQAMLAR